METRGVTEDNKLQDLLVTRSGKLVTGTNGITAQHVVSQYLVNNTSNEMAVNGSVTPLDFSITAQQGETIYLERAVLTIQGGTQDFQSVNFGSISALLNGVSVIIKIAGVFDAEVSLFKSNIDLARAMYDYTNPFKDGAYVGRWTFSKDTRSPIKLVAGESALFRIRDDLSGLTSFKCIVRGFRVLD